MHFLCTFLVLLQAFTSLWTCLLHLISVSDPPHIRHGLEVPRHEKGRTLRRVRPWWSWSAGRLHLQCPPDAPMDGFNQGRATRDNSGIDCPGANLPGAVVGAFTEQHHFLRCVCDGHPASPGIGPGTMRAVIIIPLDGSPPVCCRGLG